MENNITRFETAAKWTLWVLAALLPLWMIPRPIGVEFGREVTFGALILLAGILWMLAILTKGEARFRHSPVCYGAGFLLLVFGLSTIFSKAPMLSALFADPTAERFSTLVLGVLLMVVLGGVFRSSGEAGVSLLVLLFSGGVAGLFNLGQLYTGWTPYKLVAPFVQGLDFNVIGTVNGFSLFFAMLFIMGIGLLASNVSNSWRGWVKTLLWVSSAVFLLNLLSVNFRTSWVVLFGAGMILFGLTFKSVQKTWSGSSSFSDRRGFNMTLGILILSIVMFMVRSPVIKELNLPAEVSPALRSTLNVATSVFKESPKNILLGSGPGTFGLLWGKYKDPSINQTIFWGVRFNQGFSWVSTLVATSGLLGALALVVFMGLSLFLFLKEILALSEDNPLATSALLGFVASVIIAFVYPANFTFVLLLFFIAGLLTVLLSREKSAAVFAGDGTGMGRPKEDWGEPRQMAGGGFLKPFWTMRDISIRFEAPWAVFISSLVLIFVLSLSIGGIYLEWGKLRSALAQQIGMEKLSAGKTDEAIADLERAVRSEQNNFRNYQSLIQARTQKIRELIGRAAAGENVQQEFQTAVNTAIQETRRATDLNPQEPLIWRTQGALYELIIPFIPGSEKFAASAYSQAMELDPLNPAGWVDLGRSHLVYADRLLLALGQTNSEERKQIEQARFAALKEAETALIRASEVKPDFAPAHFLLSQTSIRLGNLQAAIRSTENAKITAPFDIGIAFQLGLLYYQASDLGKAEQEFARAVSISSNYSNARYFLGLIYDRRGETKKAIEQFENIRQFNPDNQEVKKILTNLYNGRGALSDIVPPGTPPEKRTEPPVPPAVQ